MVISKDLIRESMNSHKDVYNAKDPYGAQAVVEAPTVEELAAENIRLKRELEKIKQEHKRSVSLAEEKFCRTFYLNQIPMIISRLNDAVYIDVNYACVEVLGYQRKEMINKSAFDLNVWVDESERNEIIKVMYQCGTVRDKEIRFRAKTGEIIWTLASFSHIQLAGEDCMIGSLVNITARKKAERASQVSEDKFSRAFYDNQAKMLFVRLKDLSIIDVNRKTIEVTGHSRDEMIGSSVTDYMDSEDIHKMLHHIYTDGHFEDAAFTFTKKSGGKGHGIMTGKLMQIEDEEYVLVSIIDITKRYIAEEELRLSHRDFFRAFNTNPLPMIIASADSGKIIEVNQAVKQKGKFLRVDFVGRRPIDIGLWLDPADQEKYREIIKREKAVKNFETKILTIDNRMMAVLLSGTLIKWKGEKCILTVVNDITDLRRYQAEVARLDRLHMVGEMFASIAHEIRNPMTTIRGFLQLMMSKDQYSEDREFMKIMIEELDVTSALISEFLSLAKNKNVHMKPGNLNTVLEALMPLLQADALKNDFNLVMELHEIPAIVFDESEIRQMVLNLSCNGFEAMSPGGTLTIRTYEANNQVTLAVEDQGHGIALEIMDRIGTPFFTTKTGGYGLGLAVCNSIAHRHQARIDIDTGSSGTTFSVRFKLPDR